MRTNTPRCLTSIQTANGSQFLQQNPAIQYTQTTQPSLQQLQACLQVNAACFTAHANACMDDIILALRELPGVHVQLLGLHNQLLGYAITITQRGHAKLQDTPFYDTHSSFFAMAAIHPSLQGSGAYRLLNTMRLQRVIDQQIDYFFVRTQNPKVFLMQSQLLQDAVLSGQLAQASLVWAGSQQTPFDGIVSALPETVPAHQIPPEFHQINVHRGDVGLFVWQLRRIPQPAHASITPLPRAFGSAT